MKAPSLLFLLLLTGWSFPGAFSAEYYHVWKLADRFDEPIADMDQWAADNFSDGPNAERDDWKLEKSDLDIDHDG